MLPFKQKLNFIIGTIPSNVSKGDLTMTILITAFEPFQQETTNATMAALSLLPDRLCGVTLEKRVIPVVFGEAIDAVTKLVDDLLPDAVVCLGQASGRADITPEPVDAPIRADGPAAYFSTLPVKAMVQARKEAGVPASLSNTAGTFVCNDLMYGLLDHLARTGQTIPAGFIHVPATPAQACGRPTPSMAPETVAKGLEAALKTLIMK